MISIGMKRIGAVAALSAVTLCMFAQGCGSQSASTEDSETHFLHCDQDMDCAALGDEFVCHEEVCRDRNELTLDAGSQAATPGGAGGAAGTSMDSSAGIGGAPTPGPFTLDLQPVPTEVLILVDRSSTMFAVTTESTSRWEMVRRALIEDDGAMVQLAQEVSARMAYYTTTGDYEPRVAGQCPVLESSAPEATALDMDVFFFDYNVEEADAGGLQTPTAEGLRAGLQLLSQGTPPERQAVLLITDGYPDSCEDVNGECVMDQSIAAAQEGFDLGIPTLIVTFDPLEGNLCTGRCEFDLIQDLANAGVGLPVQANTPDYAACVDSWGRDLEGTYAAEGEAPGTAPYAILSDGHPLNASNIVQLLNQQFGCLLRTETYPTLDGLASLRGADGDLGDLSDGTWVVREDGSLLIHGVGCHELGPWDQGVLHLEGTFDPPK